MADDNKLVKWTGEQKDWNREGSGPGRAAARRLQRRPAARPGPQDIRAARPGPARPVAPRCGPARPGPVARAARPAAREVACQQACCTGVSVCF